MTDLQSAKNYLKQNHRLDELIASNREELKDLEELKDSIPALDYSKDKVQVSPTNDASYTRIVEKICLLEDTIKEDIEKLLDLKLEIRTVINDVHDNDEKLVLKHKYLNFMTWEKVAEIMNVSIRTACRIHETALQHVKVPETFEIN